MRAIRQTPEMSLPRLAQFRCAPRYPKQRQIPRDAAAVRRARAQALRASIAARRRAFFFHEADSLLNLPNCSDNNIRAGQLDFTQLCQEGKRPGVMIVESGKTLGFDSNG